MFDEIRPRRGRDGREARTALPVPARTKALLAVVGAVVCAGMALLAWRLGGWWLPWVLVALAVWALADLGWQWYRHTKRSKR